MAGYNYYPYIPQYYPATYQPVIQQQPQQQQSQQTSGIVWISGANEAQMYPVAPNNAVALWDTNGKVLYLKQADATGKPTMHVYDLVEHAETADGKQTDFATKEDLGKVAGLVKSIDDVIEALKTDIETMKGDMYGIAGKKKAVKKAEAEDDA